MAKKSVHEMSFGVYRNSSSKCMKVFKSVSLQDILRDYTHYAFEKGYTTFAFNPKSFGNTARSNENGDQLLLKKRVD